jgi:hypothetical protein
MYSTLIVNPYKSDICITQLAILLYLEKQPTIPTYLKDNKSFKYLLNLLKDKYYLQEDHSKTNQGDTIYELTQLGKKRCEIYTLYRDTNIIPRYFRAYRNPVTALKVVQSTLKKLSLSSLYTRYLYSYEAILVYRLNHEIDQAMLKDLRRSYP